MYIPKQSSIIACLCQGKRLLIEMNRTVCLVRCHIGFAYALQCVGNPYRILDLPIILVRFVMMGSGFQVEPIPPIYIAQETGDSRSQRIIIQIFGQFLRFQEILGRNFPLFPIGMDTPGQVPSFG